MPGHNDLKSAHQYCYELTSFDKTKVRNQVLTIYRV